MRISVIALLLFFLAFPTVAQVDEAHPYFSLSSNRTFGTGEKPTIQLWAQGVNTLQFRVYHINDPVKFFESLGDQHRFGGRTKPPARELTAIEKFHQWKTRSRASIRNLFRTQYTAESRAEVRHWEAESEQKVVEHKQGVATEYAGVPLLNAQQVALVWQQGVPKGNRWDAQTVNVNVKEKGLYLVEATDGTLRAYTIVSITDLGIIAKGSPGRVRARVVDRITGAPVANAPVVLWSTHSAEEEEGKDREIARVRSNADGLAEAALQAGKPEGVLVMARRGDDFAVASLYGWALRNDAEQSVMGYVYSDRPVYRPGHTVHFRAILRNEMATGYQIPTVKEAQVQVQDSDGKQVYQKTLPVSGMGTLHGDFDLPASAGLGYYGIEIHAGEGNASGGFNVEEYKKPEYEVKVTPSKKRVVQGEAIQAVIEAKYYYGEPVANANVTYVVHRSRYWQPWYMDEDDEQQASDQDDNSWSQKEEQDEQKGTLDAQGKLSIQVPTQDAKFDLVYRIEARVTDQANREISGAGFALATVGSYYIHVEPQQYVYQPGEPAFFTVETRDYEGNPVPRAAFTVDLVRHEWQKPEGPSLGKTSGVTDAQGKATVQIPVQSGWYMARALSKTPEGREVADTTYLWVTGGFDWGGGAGQQRVEIVPDKKSYKSGEKAKVLIVTGVPDAYLWVTVEGRTVNGSQVVRAKGGSATIEIPIVSDYAPNFFLTAVFLKDQKYYAGTKSIKVPPVEQTLSVDLKASKKEYKPGDPGVFTLDAKDSGGRPVAAEFSLGVVDEAIYAIKKEAAQDILAFFYGRKWNRVNTDTSLSYYFQGEAGKRRMQLARVRPGKALAIIKPEKMVEAKVRKLFPDTMFWTADLRTDARGHAQVSVNFPDALTMWRATARGITADSKVGSAVERTIVRKNLILRLAVPRFFREGDEVTVSALVENYLANGKNVKVSLDVQGPGDDRRRASVDRRAEQGRRQGGFQVAREDGRQRRAAGQSPHRRRIGCDGTDAAGDPVRREAERAQSRDIGRRAERGAGESGVSRGRCGLIAQTDALGDAVGGGHHFQCAGISDQFPLRLHGADHVELPAERGGVAGRAATRAQDEHQTGGSGKEDQSRARAPLRFPARGRRLGLVENRRQHGVYDGVRGGGAEAGSGGGTRCKARRHHQCHRLAAQAFPADEEGAGGPARLRRCRHRKQFR